MSDRDRSAVVDAVSTPERATHDIGALIGDRISLGPVPAGPGGMATATAIGLVGRMRARRAGAGRIEVTVPVHADVRVDIGGRVVPVDAQLAVRIGLVGGLADGSDVVVIEVDELGPADIDLTTTARGVGGVLVRRLGNLDAEIRQHVIGYVTDLLATPQARELLRIPLEEEADSA